MLLGSLICFASRVCVEGVAMRPAIARGNATKIFAKTFHENVRSTPAISMGNGLCVTKTVVEYFRSYRCVTAATIYLVSAR